MTSLLLGLFLLLLLALVILFVSLSKTKFLKYILPLIFIPVTVYMYSYWGAYQDLKLLEQKKKNKQLTAQALKQFKGPADIIKRMKQHLNTPSGNTSKGWCLLGRLYSSQKQFTNSNQAFAKAYVLNSNDLKIKLSYIESIYIVNGQKTNKKINVLLADILKQNPVQLDALNFIAIDAFTKKDYSKASIYWQKMLPVLPDGSQEKKSLLKAIANAQKQQKEIIK